MFLLFSVQIIKTGNIIKISASFAFKIKIENIFSNQNMHDLRSTQVGSARWTSTKII
jgi:hypothetical protein